ncbi:hypothetical protein KXV31_004672, partial [Aspergillus fumigatus]
KDILDLQQETNALTGVLTALKELLEGPNGSKLAVSRPLFDDLERCISTLANLKKVMKPRTTQKPMKIFGLRALKWPLKRAEVDASISDIGRYRSLFSLALQVDELGFTTRIDHSISLSRLQTAKGAAFDSYENQHDECLLGTRTKLLSDIEKWAISPQGKCIFWLNGMAGTGKSTISRTVAHHLIPIVRNTLDRDPNISEKMLKEQFESLIYLPLLEIRQRSTDIMVVVIDALDECDREDDVRLILRLLPQVQKSKSIRLRFLLTSRPELPIRLELNSITDDHQELILHEISEPVIQHLPSI